MASNQVLIIVGLASFAGIFADIVTREVTTRLYPDCESYKSCREARNQTSESSNHTNNFPNVVYVRAAGSGTNDDDVLHFVLSTMDVPSLLIVHTVGDTKASMSFDWDHLLLTGNFTNSTDIAGAITASAKDGSVKYSFVVMFTKLLEYDDLHDVVKISDDIEESLLNIRNFTNFTWMNVTTGKNGHSIIFNTTSSQPEPLANHTAGSLSFEFEINSKDGRDDDLPRLLFNSNNTQMNFVLDQFVPTFNKSRFALEVAIVSSETPDTMLVDVTKSIDDEYSPGVFKVVNWYSQASRKDSAGYLQWKPVCYLEKERSRSAGTEMRNDDLRDPKDVPHLSDLLYVSLARAFFGNQSVVQKATNVSFGLSQDGFYVKNNYTAWTASVGYGTPPVETISQLVIIIIVAGLGIPVVVILFGGIYVCVRKLRRRNENQALENPTAGGYARIN